MISQNPNLQVDPASESAGSGDYRKFLLLLWHWIWLVLLVIAAAGAAAYLVSKRITPVYETSTKLLVLEASSSSQASYQDVLTSERLTRTYSSMMTNESLLQEVIDNLALPLGMEDLKEMVRVTPVRDTQLIEVFVEGNDPQQIADIANDIVTVFLERINSIQSERYSKTIISLQSQMENIESILDGISSQIDDLDSQIVLVTPEAGVDPAQSLITQKESLQAQLVQYQQIYADLLTNYEQTRLAETQSSANIILVNAATPPDKPIKPNVLVNILIAVSAAGLLSIGILFLINFMNDTIISPEQVETTLGLPVYGVIFRHDTNSDVISQAQPMSMTSEAFRSLRTNIVFHNEKKGVKTLLVTSPALGSGKSLVSANLAVILAQSGKVVTLVDVDLRKPSVHRNFMLPNEIGVSTLLNDSEAKIEDVHHKPKTEGLSVITSGSLPPNPSELLGSKNMLALIENLKKVSDIVIFDAPPVLAVADPVVMSTLVDGVLLVFKPGKTTVITARQTVRSLQRVGANIIGVVLNDIKMRGSLYHQYYRRSYGEYHSDYSGEN